jgi:hypothetical protein
MNFNKTVIRKIKMAPVVAELFMAWREDNLNPALRTFLTEVLKEFAVRNESNLSRPLRAIPRYLRT